MTNSSSVARPGLICTLLLTALLLGYSCQHTATKESLKNSPEVEKLKSYIIKTEARGLEYRYLTIEYIDSVFPNVRKLSIPDQCFIYNYKSYHFLWFSADAKVPEAYADSILLAISGKEKYYKSYYSQALADKAQALSFGENFEMAFEYYYKAYKFATENLDKCDAGQFSYKIGEFKLEQGYYKEAIPYLKQAIAGLGTCSNIKEQIGSLISYQNSLAACFRLSGRFNDAIISNQKKLSLLDSNALYNPEIKEDLKPERCITYAEIGTSYAELNNFTAAEKYLKLAYAFLEKEPDFDFRVTQQVRLKLVDFYTRNKRLSEAGVFMKQLEQTMAQHEYSKQMPAGGRKKYFEVRWRYLDAIGQHSQAYPAMKKFYNYRDSLEKEDIDLKRADIDKAFKLNEQKYKLAVADKKSTVKQIYMIVFIAFSAIVVLVLLLVWRNRKKLQVLNVQITEQNEEITTQNEDMHKALIALEQSQEENTRMMKVVAHDLRSPIAATLSITGLLKSLDLKTEDREMLELLETSNQHALEMIVDLLNVNTTSERLSKETVDMHKLLSHCISMLRFRTEEKKQKLITELQEAEIQADGAKIWRVVNNLIVNAIKFTPTNGTIEIGMQKQGGSLLLYVKDNGIGISPELRGKIFDIFTDARKQGTSGEQSFGLGLAISKQIVEAHGGKIWVESEIGKGSTFFVELPTG